MKILYVTHGLPPEKLGGVELHTEHLARHAAREHDVEVLLPASDPGMLPFAIRRETRGGLRVARVRAPRGRFRFEAVYRNPKLDAAFARHLDETRPDVVHVHSLIHLSFGMLDVLRERAIPTVMTLHDYFSVCPLGQRIRRDLDLCVELDRERCARCLRPPLSRVGEIPWPRRPLEAARLLAERAIKSPSVRQLHAHDRFMRELLRGVDLLVTPSRFHRERFVEYGIDPDRIRVVENGLVPFDVPPRRPDPEGRVRLGYVGLVMPTKGVHVLLDAFGRMRARNVSLELHGSAPGTRGSEDYRSRLRELAPDDRPVRFHGRFEGSELPAILAGLDALVVPSVWWESYCLTAREGFLAGVPVIASRIGALEEAFEEGRGGLGFRAGDPADLARVLDRFAGDEDLRASLAASIPRVRTMEECARELLEIYAGLVGR